MRSHNNTFYTSLISIGKSVCLKAFAKHNKIEYRKINLIAYEKTSYQYIIFLFHFASNKAYRRKRIK